MKLAVLAAVLMLASACAWAQGAVGKEDVTVETTPEGCQLRRYTVSSPSMQRDIRVVVVLPPGYADSAEQRYPVLYALHGRGAPYDTWSQMSPLRKALRDMPMIVVCFDGDRAGWYVDSTKKKDSQFCAFFFDELMPHVADAYRTSGLQAVTGFSMGGHGAFYYMLTRPEMFTSVSALSAAFMEEGAWGADFEELLGDFEENKEAYRKTFIAERIEQYVTDGVKLPPMMSHCGTEDFLLERNRGFNAFMAEQNKRIRQRLEPQVAGIADQRERARKLDALVAENRLEFLYKESPGTHNWAFWRDASDEVVAFHWSHFKEAMK